MYEADGTVLESPSHGPELCQGQLLLSHPPRCRGIPIVGWDWDTVDEKESVRGTTWGRYHVVGTFDGEQIRLTAPPVPLP